MASDAVIVAAVRSPVGLSHRGRLRDLRPDDLAAAVVKGLLERIPGLDPALVDDVLLGNSQPEGEAGGNLARFVVHLAGLPDRVAAATVDRSWAAGLQAIVQGCHSVAQGMTRVVLAGGTESASRVPVGGHSLSVNRALARLRPETTFTWGEAAEALAARFGISRERQDAFALDSHRKALTAQSAGRLGPHLIETVPAHREDGTPDGRRRPPRDEAPRPDLDLEALAGLPAAFSFEPHATVTRGNSAPLGDCAAVLAVMDAATAREAGASPLVALAGATVAGVAPDIAGVGQAEAVRRLLGARGLTADDIDLFEIDEATAAQCIHAADELGIPPERLNVNGGAIALGNPLGASGARAAVDLIAEMGRRRARYGVVATSAVGGQGLAVLFERLEES